MVSTCGMTEPKKRTSLLSWILLGLILIGIALLAPLFMRTHHRGKNSNHTQAVNNARQLGLAMLEFEQEYGKFPDASTGEIMMKKPENKHQFKYTTSNDFLSQLVAADIITNTSAFYAETAYTKKRIRTDKENDNTLGAGDVGFGYLMNGTNGLSTNGNPARPYLCAPLAYDGKNVSTRHFDPDIYDAKAVVLRLDGSVQAPTIDKKRKIMHLGGGKSLLDTGEDTIWGKDTKPVIIPPLPAR